MRIKTTIIKFHCGNEGERRLKKRQQQYLGPVMEITMSAFEAERIETRASEGKDNANISQGIEME